MIGPQDLAEVARDRLHQSRQATLDALGADLGHPGLVGQRHGVLLRDEQHRGLVGPARVFERHLPIEQEPRGLPELGLVEQVGDRAGVHRGGLGVGRRIRRVGDARRHRVDQLVEPGEFGRHPVVGRPGVDRWMQTALVFDPAGLPRPPGRPVADRLQAEAGQEGMHLVVRGVDPLATGLDPPPIGEGQGADPAAGAGGGLDQDDVGPGVTEVERAREARHARAHDHHIRHVGALYRSRSLERRPHAPPREPVPWAGRCPPPVPRRRLRCPHPFVP